MEDVTFFNRDMEEIRDVDSDGLWSSLNDPQQHTYMRVNNKMFSFNQPDTDVVQEATQVNEERWGQ